MAQPDYAIGDRLAEMYPLFHWHARKFVGLAGAEADDLVQEAATKVWLAIESGYEQTTHFTTVIDNAMKNWVRTLSRQGWNEDPGYVQPE
jgi:DNA-directed RNA polymerase specialized sigma24 family protein